MIDNKWHHGEIQLVLPPLPSNVLTTSGLKPLSLILDEELGPEVVLLITDSEEEIVTFGNCTLVGLWLKSGLVKTSYGPIYWMLFYFPDPLTGGRLVYENLVNPLDKEHVEIYKNLASQKYWHLVMADEKGTVVNFFEFHNKYGLEEALQKLESVTSNRSMTDFILAKNEYQKNYSIDALLEI